MAAAGVPVSAIEALGRRAGECNRMLEEGTGAGADFLGWVSLPSSVTETELRRVKDAAEKLRAVADVVVVVGIGGSYLGARAVLEALGNPFACLRRERSGPDVVFAGQNISEDYLYDLLEALQGRSVGVIVISKSGTTTEPAIAFRILRGELERRYGKAGARERIVAVTDRSRGALKGLADREGYATFVIPDDVGGRYSVLTPVGLLPLAAAGVDIGALVAGAREMEAATAAGVPFGRNPAEQYAAARQRALRSRIQGGDTRQLRTVAPLCRGVVEAAVRRERGQGGEGYLPGFRYPDRRPALHGTIYSGGRENVVRDGRFGRFAASRVADRGRRRRGRTRLSGRPAFERGEPHGRSGRCPGPLRRRGAQPAGGHRPGRCLWCRRTALFFERACGISGYLLGVNPFDQPGVEAYKRNMYALLDKPGYEEEGRRLRERLKER
mgnify:CR=1 FL=1